MSTIARRTLRQAALTALQTLTGVTVESPGNLETPPAKLPHISLHAPMDRKSPIAKSAADFTTTVTLELMASTAGATPTAAQDAIEALCARIEDVVLGCVVLLASVQQVSNFSTQTKLDSDGDRHTAQARMVIDFETFEVFDPLAIDPTLTVTLNMLNVHVDTVQPFDAAGTYSSPPFPDSVPAAPRTSGPDGRDEGHLQITLNT